MRSERTKKVRAWRTFLGALGLCILGSHWGEHGRERNSTMYWRESLWGGQTSGSDAESGKPSGGEGSGTDEKRWVLAPGYSVRNRKELPFQLGQLLIFTLLFLSYSRYSYGYIGRDRDIHIDVGIFRIYISYLGKLICEEKILNEFIG